MLPSLEWEVANLMLASFVTSGSSQDEPEAVVDISKKSPIFEGGCLPQATEDLMLQFGRLLPKVVAEGVPRAFSKIKNVY